MFKEIEIKHLWRFRVLEVGLAHGDFEAATRLDLVSPISWVFLERFPKLGLPKMDGLEMFRMDFNGKSDSNDLGILRVQETTMFISYNFSCWFLC